MANQGHGSNAGHLPKVLLASMSGSHGGMEMRMRQDASLLQSHGWRPVISTPTFPERTTWYAALRRQGIAIAYLPYPYVLEHWPSRHFQRVKGQLVTAPILSRRRFDLVHVFLSWTTYGLGMLWAAARAGIPALVSVHNAFPMTTFGPWHRKRLDEAFATTQRIIAVSDSALEHFLNVFAPYLPNATDTAVIPNPVDTARFRPHPSARSAARQRLGVPDDAIAIGSIGRLDKQKQPWKLVETIAELHKLGVPAHLILIGQGVLEAALRRQVAELGLAEYVVFTGYVHDVENLMPALDLHLLLSRNEGFGIVTAEAMAAGVPALGTDVPGTRDVLQGMAGGHILPSDQESAIARHVAQLLASPNRLETMAAEGPKEVQYRFGREHIDEATFATYVAALQLRN
jgi:glycosyltransferase involved in cell wall biosynthesis